MAAELLHIVSHIGYDVCKELSSQIYEIENENETDWFIQQKGCCLWKLPKIISILIVAKSFKNLPKGQKIA